MKRKLFFVPLLAAAVLAGCSSDDIVNNAGIGTDGDGSTSVEGIHYLSVNVLSTPGTSGAFGAPAVRADYEDGLIPEYSVNKVRFYFFDSEGNAAAVKGNKALKDSYMDWTPTSIPDNENENIDHELNTDLVIETEKGDLLPTQMLAVTNPDMVPALPTAIADCSLKNISAILQDYAATAMKGTGDATVLNGVANQFVMANSVYLMPDRTIACANRLTLDNFKKTAAAATGAPVNVYVERTMAKVRVKPTSPSGQLHKKAKKTLEGGEAIQVEGQDIYIKTLGWNVTNYTDKATLVKSIDNTWTNNGVGFEWNKHPYFRSFWAKMPADGVANHFTKYLPDYGNTVSFTENQNFTFANENTKGGEDATELIVWAQVCDNNGNSIELGEYRGAKTVGETHLLDIYADVLQTGKDYYRIEGTTPVRLKGSDLKFITATVADKAGANFENEYSVYAQLAKTEGVTFFTTKHDADPTVIDNRTNITVEALNAELLALGDGKLWKGGRCYFYTTIKHATHKVSSEPIYGIVRNHLYDITIDNFIGLGTPVYDPSETIHTVKPTMEESYLAATIKILSWKVVESNVDLGL